MEAIRRNLALVREVRAQSTTLLFNVGVVLLLLVLFLFLVWFPDPQPIGTQERDELLVGQHLQPLSTFLY